MSESEENETPTATEGETTELEQAIDSATEAVSVQTSQLGELADATGAGGPANLGHLFDVPVRITVEVGRTKMSLGNLCKLTPGSLVELDREAHQPADILVNGKVVARGEIVTIDDNYGVRITSVET